jgi:hypothetical protein
MFLSLSMLTYILYFGLSEDRIMISLAYRSVASQVAPALNKYNNSTTVICFVRSK